MPKGSRGSRLSADERRLSILAAAMPLFAQQGFKGTTTKQIASAANISEALLYRHFPSKESLYSELQGLLCTKSHKYSEIVETLEPSTSTLVNSVHFLISVVFIGEPEGTLPDPNPNHYIARLLMHSFIEDGRFARSFYETHVALWAPKWEACVEASRASGDMVDTGVPSICSWWFTHHIAMALKIIHLPNPPVVDYEGLNREALLNHAVRFALRGFGLKDEVIQAHHNPEMLQWFTQRLFAKPHGPAAEDQP